MTTQKDLSGKQLGDYKLIRQFASGGMAHIYLGEDKNLKRKAAVKVLSPDLAGGDAILRDRFEREARAVANLHHPNIIPIYQFNKVGDVYFIAMRYVEGDDFADEIKKYRERGELMPPQRWLPILKQVAGALDHAHLRGIVHRDVKPSNILLEGNDEAYLSDFGLVLWEDMDKTMGTAFGTPRYISPEQATDSQQAVPQSDIYSLAVIVYELVTGRVIFKGKTPMEVALSHITEQPTPPRAHNPNVPSAAQNEIMKALQKDATKRHQTAEEFISRLAAAYEADIVTTPSAPQEEAEGTVAFRPEDLEEISESSREILDGWDEPVAPTKESEMTPVVGNATPVQKPKRTIPEPPPKIVTPPRPKEGGGLPIRLLGVVVVLALVGAAAFYFMNPGAVGGGSRNMVVHYNDNFFAIINTSQNTNLILSDMKVTGRSSEPDGTGFGDVLAPGDCIFVIRSGRGVIGYAR